MLSECGEREDGLNTSRHSQRGRWERGKMVLIQIGIPNEDVGNEGKIKKRILKQLQKQ